MADRVQIIAEFIDEVTAGIAKVSASLNKLKATAAQVTSTTGRVGKGITDGLKQVDVAGAVDDTSASFFKWRESFGKASGTINQFVNNSARVVRALARIRTAFFLLVTVFAVRPIIAFFRAMADGSAAARESVREIGERFAYIRSILSESFAPILKTIVENLYKAANDAIDALNNSKQEVRTILELMFRIFNVVIGISKVIFNAGRFAVQLGRVFVDVFVGVGAGLRAIFEGTIDAVAAYAFDKLAKVFEALDTRNASGFIRTFTFSSLLSELTGVAEYAGSAAKRLREFAAAAREGNGAAEQAGKVAVGFFEDAAKAADLAVGPANDLVESFRKLAIESLVLTNAQKTLISEGLDKVIPKLAAAFKDAPNEAVRHLRTFKEGIENFVADIKKNIIDRQLKTLTGGVQDAFEGLIGETFIQAFQQRTIKFRDIFRNFIEDLNRIASKLVAQQFFASFIAPLIGGIGGLFSGGANPAPVVTSSLTGNPAPVISSPVSAAAQSFPVASPQQRSGVVINMNIQAMDGPSVEQTLRTKGKAIIKGIMVDAANGGDASVRTAFGLSG